jgi:ankyrin repeat protein
MEQLDKHGRNALHICALTGNAKIFSLLMTYPKFSELSGKRDKQGNSCLHLAKNTEIMKVLVVDCRCGINAENESGYDIVHIILFTTFRETPLLVSTILHGDVELIKALLSYDLLSPLFTYYIRLGANITHANKYERNALYLAAYYGYDHLVTFFKEHKLAFTEQSSSTLTYTTLVTDNIYPRIATGTLEALVRHLVNNQFLDDRFMRAFFINYREFITSLQLFQTIIAR